MAYEYMMLEAAYSGILARLVTEKLAAGWDLWGNPFAVEGELEGTVPGVHLFQAMVRQVENGSRAAQEVPGYTVGVPETPSAEDFRQLGQAIATGFPRTIPAEQGMVS